MEGPTLNKVRDRLGRFSDVVHELPTLSTSDSSGLTYVVGCNR
jgi:hypothetical protein